MVFREYQKRHAGMSSDVSLAFRTTVLCGVPGREPTTPQTKRSGSGRHSRACMWHGRGVIPPRDACCAIPEIVTSLSLCYGQPVERDTKEDRQGLNMAEKYKRCRKRQTRFALVIRREIVAARRVASRSTRIPAGGVCCTLTYIDMNAAPA